MKRASLFVFEDRYLIHSVSTLVSGGGIASKPYIKMAKDTLLKDVASKLIFAMDQSKINVPNSPSDNTINDYLVAMELKNHKDLYKNSICCAVYEKDNMIFFIPTINSGIRGGFDHMPKKKVEVDAHAAMEKISIALQQALDLCE